MQPVETWHEQDATQYFEGERRQGYAWLAAGLVLGCGGVASLATRFAEAMWPFVGVAAIQLWAAAMLLTTSRQRVAKIVSWSAEQWRIERVVRKFAWIERIEVAVFVAAAIAAVVWGAHRWLFAGLAIQSAAMLVLDRAAHRRARHYADSWDAIPRQRREIHERMERMR